MYVDLDRVSTDLIAPFAQVFNKLFLADNSASPLQQDLQQRQFARGKINIGAANFSHLADLVIGEVAVAHQWGGTCMTTTRQGAYPRLQLIQRERLGEVVVRAKIETTHAILNAVQGSENQHWHLGFAHTQSLQDFQPAHLGQAEIQDNQIKLAICGRPISVLASIDAIHGVPGVAQRVRQCRSQTCVILRDEYSHSLHLRIRGASFQCVRIACAVSGVSRRFGTQAYTLLMIPVAPVNEGTWTAIGAARRRKDTHLKGMSAVISYQWNQIGMNDSHHENASCDCQ